MGGRSGIAGRVPEDKSIFLTGFDWRDRIVPLNEGRVPTRAIALYFCRGAQVS